MRTSIVYLFLFSLVSLPAFAQEASSSQYDASILNDIDIFDLEWASDPQISPDGGQVAYVRNFMDIMTDRKRSNIWIVNADGSGNRPITTGIENDSSPRWSPDGTRLLYTSNSDGSRQLYLRWMDTGQTARLTNLSHAASSLEWSPDGKWIAFSMFVPTKSEPFTKMPEKPAGAEWADPPRVITDMYFRADGRGFLPEGKSQIFVVSADGGSARQLTTASFSHTGRLSWTPDGNAILFSQDRRDDDAYETPNSDLFLVGIEDGVVKQLTDRFGPDAGATVSPDGRQVAYIGYDEKFQGYQLSRLSVMNIDGSNSRVISGGLDRSIGNATWNTDSQSLVIKYVNHGRTRLAIISLDGEITNLTDELGGTSLGRPYSSGQYSVSSTGAFAFTYGTSSSPADVGIGRVDGGNTTRLTGLNDDIFGHKSLGRVEEIWFESSFDQRRIQGWIVYPPGFDETKKYPFILEIHGGPFASYGPEFTSEIQLFSARGYVVLYTNPRGSTSYGEEFGNLIHHAYPSQDYDDLMSGVDAVIDRGFVDEENLFVTGGSGGGVLSAWIVGKTDRFKAAVVAKPVINWLSFSLISDGAYVYPRYWFPGPPWENVEHYWNRSPLSLVGNVTTPTMLLSGESDLRTPISEAEQFYQALKIRMVDTALTRIPEASHGITARPSNLIAKVNYILAWFEKYRTDLD